MDIIDNQVGGMSTVAHLIQRIGMNKSYIKKKFLYVNAHWTVGDIIYAEKSVISQNLKKTLSTFINVKI